MVIILSFISYVLKQRSEGLFFLHGISFTLQPPDLIKDSHCYSLIGCDIIPFPPYAIMPGFQQQMHNTHIKMNAEWMQNIK